MRILSAMATFFLGSTTIQPIIRVSMSQLPDESIRVAVTNTGNEDIKLLRDPTSALSPEAATDKFEFQTIGEGYLPYFDGIKVNWLQDMAKNLPEAYVTIPAHETINFDHNLYKAYSFSNFEATQKFTISLIRTTFIARDTFIPFSSPSLTISISGRPMNGFDDDTPCNLRVPGGSCSNSQLKTLDDAWNSAMILTFEAAGRLLSDVSRSPRYKTWFGEYNEKRKNTVYDIYDKIGNMYKPRFDCTCNNTAWNAYVCPRRLDLGIFLCPPYWNIPSSGPDSQGGTLVHEASHFEINGGTDDVDYGKPNCTKLAKERPDDAIRNAASMKYFAENDPYLQ